jgi:hypothetical protein
LNRKLVVLTATILIALIVLSLFLVFNSLSNQTTSRQFYVGVEYAYGNNETAQVQVSQIKALVDKVKDYTNLFVIGSVGFKFDQPALSEACDYIFNAKLYFIVLFTGLDMYSYSITDWMQDAKVKYGDRFLGIYKYDEPGGNQLDQGPSMLINKTFAGENPTYSSIASYYVGNLSVFPEYYLNYAPEVLTADYGLYWFDYKAGYSTLFGEFVGNQSRERHIALCRGAATSFGKDFGVIITWKYDQAPYLESGSQLYNDLSLAYSSGAKYAIVFSYPDVTSYGTLTPDHFEALQKFWNTLNSNPGSFGRNQPEVVYVVPKDYGFGFRDPNDTIWGLFPADALSEKIFNDTITLTAKYGSRYDILYDEQKIIDSVLHKYSKVFYWNQTVT